MCILCDICLHKIRHIHKICIHHSIYILWHNLGYVPINIINLSTYVHPTYVYKLTKIPVWDPYASPFCLLRTPQIQSYLFKGIDSVLHQPLCLIDASKFIWFARTTKQAQGKTLFRTSIFSVSHIGSKNSSPRAFFFIASRRLILLRLQLMIDWQVPAPERVRSGAGRGV